MSKRGYTLRGTLLVAGTSIGGGMLGLPVLTSQGGFIPSLAIYFLCWLFMASTGLLFLELCLWMPEESNIISMAKHTLGKAGKAAAWCLYLFLFYCLTLAYVVGCGGIIHDLLSNVIPVWMGPLIFLTFFAPFVYFGARIAGKLNIILMLGLGISFIAFFALGIREIKLDFLTHQDWPKSLLALPISFTAFAFQGIIPTLVHDLDYDVKRARKAILIGSFIPLVAYTIWQCLILGIIPVYGPGGLLEAMENGQNAVQPLKNILQGQAVYIIGQYFAFFALVTSFFGVTLGLVDFLADGLKIKKDTNGKLLLCSLVLIPPLLLAFLYPHVFLQALDYAGGFGCALLLGLLPVLMVWAGRYRLHMRGAFTLPGGKPLLIVLFLFVLFELAIEILT